MKQSIIWRRVKLKLFVESFSVKVILSLSYVANYGDIKCLLPLILILAFLLWKCLSSPISPLFLNIEVIYWSLKKDAPAWASFHKIFEIFDETLFKKFLSCHIIQMAMIRYFRFIVPKRVCDDMHEEGRNTKIF